MKITIFIGGLSGGGAERVCCNLANYLVRKDHAVTLLTMSCVASSYALEKEVKHIALISKNEKRNFISDNCIRLVRFIKYLKNTDSDIILAMLPGTMLMLLVFSRYTSAKIAIAERNSPWRMNKYIQWFINRLANRADLWFYQTDEVKRWYSRYTANCYNYVIPNAINPEFIKPSFNGVRKKIIVNVGRLNKQKNQELLIVAFSMVIKKHPDYVLQIFGDGPLKEYLLERISQLGIESNVQLKGFTTNVSDKIKDATCFVLSSDYEGMPNALMEAMALGIPCISTKCDGGGTDFLIKNGYNGVIIPKKDVSSLTNAINFIIENRAFADSIGHNAEKIKCKLSASVIYNQWEEYLTVNP